MEHRLDKYIKKMAQTYILNIYCINKKKVARTADKRASGLGKSPQTQRAAPARILGRL